ncbi:MAG: hypothetical protein U0Q12_28165 [Vicinamibacterales bacterium]
MDVDTVLFVTAAAVQASGALLLAGLMGVLHRAYRYGFLKWWAISWVACAVWVASTEVALLGVSGLSPVHPRRLVPAFVGVEAGYLQVVFLLVGTYEIATRWTVSPQMRRRLVAGALVLGAVVVAASIAPDVYDVRLFARHGLRRLVAAAGLFVAAFGVGWTRRTSRGLGRRLAAFAMLLLALQELHLFGVTVYGLVAGRLPGYLPFLGFADASVQMVLGLGMVAWLLDEERTRLVGRVVEHPVFRGIGRSAGREAGPADPREDRDVPSAFVDAESLPFPGASRAR